MSVTHSHSALIDCYATRKALTSTAPAGNPVIEYWYYAYINNDTVLYLVMCYNSRQIIAWLFCVNFVNFIKNVRQLSAVINYFLSLL